MPRVSRSDRPAVHAVAQHAALRVLAGAAFLLLLTAVCLRPLFQERGTVAVTELLAAPATWWYSSQMVQCLAHLLAAGGIACGALWIVLTRQRWRASGLETGAALLGLACLLSLRNASDLRLAINAALSSILPLLMAAVLYQLLAHRPAWRKALLAGVVAMAAANAWKGTAQHLWEADQALRDYQQDKAAFWARVDRSADDPLAKIHENWLKGRQSYGYFFHPNVMASFLLLGLAGAGAALAGATSSWTRKGTPQVGDGRDRDRRGQAPARSTPSANLADGPSGHPLRTALAVLVLAGLAVWLLLVIGWTGGTPPAAQRASGWWVGGAGVKVSLLAAAAAGIAAWWLRARPRTLAIVLGGGLALLQITLIVLALRSADLYQPLEARGGKLKSIAVRLNYWRGALDLLREHPLVGVGPGQFGKYYTAHKPPYASEDTSHPHSWLLNQAAETGILGVTGLLVALAGTGWRIVRSLSKSDGRGAVAAQKVGAATAMAMVFIALPACWGIVALGDWNGALLVPLAACLAAAALVCGLARVGVGQTVLTAGLIGCLVHATVEMSSIVPGLLWPLWAAIALAMTWNSPVEPMDAPARRPWPAFAAPWAALVAAAATVILTIAPLRAAGLLARGQQAVREQRLVTAVARFREAAQVDPRSPAPLAAAALLRQRMSHRDEAHAVACLREATDLFGEAVQRDPAAYMTWRNLAMAEMYLATRSDDMAIVHRAVADMQKALVLYPNWPAGWLELAGMAGVETAGPSEDRALLQIALAALDRAASLDDLWPADDARKFTPQDRTNLRRMQARFTQRLNSAPPSAPR